MPARNTKAKVQPSSPMQPQLRVFAVNPKGANIVVAAAQTAFEKANAMLGKPVAGLSYADRRRGLTLVPGTPEGPVIANDVISPRDRLPRELQAVFDTARLGGHTPHLVVCRKLGVQECARGSHLEHYVAPKQAVQVVSLTN